MIVSGRDWALSERSISCTELHNTSGSDTGSSLQTPPFPPGSLAHSTAGHSRWCPWLCCCKCGPVSPGSQFFDSPGKNRVSHRSRSGPACPVVLCCARQESGSCRRCYPSPWRRRWSAPTVGLPPPGNEAFSSNTFSRCTTLTVRDICTLSACRASPPGMESTAAWVQLDNREFGTKREKNDEENIKTCPCLTYSHTRTHRLVFPSLWRLL